MTPGDRGLGHGVRVGGRLTNETSRPGRKDITVQVFVTGGSGYLGQATIAALLARGHRVAALARGDAAARRVSALGAAVVRGGLTDLGTLRAAAADADAAIHLAQDYGPGTAQVDLAAATAMQDGLGARPYVHTGGAWVFGDTAPDAARGGAGADESAPQAAPPITAWRRDNEKRVLARAGDGGHPVLVMPGVVYGYGGGLIGHFLAEPARRGEAHYIGDGSNHWGVVHVDDVAGLYVAALAAPAGGVYLGVDEQHPTMHEIAEALSAGAGRPRSATSISLAQARREMGPIADAFALDQRLSAARARRELGWTPAARDILAELASPEP
jgi:nucleoside-diphosphate-sugar epimerase